jgi:hypothetical protein
MLARHATIVNGGVSRDVRASSRMRRSFVTIT